ncbi:MAG: OmpA family protein [Proteobacteria bacterium]|nr:OmpA family protein [Pseudomonadota bacterium]
MKTASKRNDARTFRICVGVVGAAVAAVLLASPGVQAKERASKSESVGVATGFTVGAATAGPFGAIIGAAAGAWLGDRHHKQRQAIGQLEDTVSNTQWQQSRLAGEMEILTTTLASLEQGASKVSGVVQFRTGETGVRDEDRARLEQLGAWLSEYDGMVVRITGYADPRGPAELNQSLSMERAETVALILQASGVSPARLLVTGVGASPLVAERDTLDDYAFERRVQIEVEPASTTVAWAE